MVDHITMWRAYERTSEARQRAAELRRVQAARRGLRRPLLSRIRGGG